MLLNGVKLDIVCALDTTGRQLYDFVISHLSLPEPVFFGLTFLCGELCMYVVFIGLTVFFPLVYIVFTDHFNCLGRAIILVCLCVCLSVCEFGQ